MSREYGADEKILLSIGTVLNDNLGMNFRDGSKKS